MNNWIITLVPFVGREISNKDTFGSIWRQLSLQLRGNMNKGSTAKDFKGKIEDNPSMRKKTRKIA